MSYDDGYQQKPRQNTGVLYGFIGGFFLWTMYLVMMLLTHFDPNNKGDILVNILSLPLFYLLARLAAEAQYNQQRNSLNSAQGVQGAGVGAALISCALGWAFIYLRAILRDAIGIQIIIDPISLCLVTVVNFVLAIGIGKFAGSQIEKSHTYHDSY